MAWNEPGKSGQDPWGNSGGNGGGDNKPPRKSNQDDIDALLKKAQDIFGGAGNKFGNGRSGIGGVGGSVIFLVALVIWGLTGFYQVQEAERGVVTRFGAFTEQTGPGLNWHIPYPIEQVRVVNVTAINEIELGFRKDRREQSVDVLNESLMLTEDENIINMKMTVQYQIVNAKEFLFEDTNPILTLKSVTESALREVVGQSTMDFIFEGGRDDVAIRVKDLIQQRMDEYKTGLIVTSVNMQDAQPPEQVQSAFSDVVKAREDRERLINEAEAYANDILPKARGQAARELEEASAYHDRVIAQAEGESARFTSIVKEYQQAPEVTRKRLYIDAVSSVLGKTSKVFVGSESGNNLLYLPLDKMVSQGQGTVPFRLEMPAQQTSSNAANSANRSNNSGNSQRPNIREYLRNRELR
jgi:membrane protease subunit HflK